MAVSTGFYKLTADVTNPKPDRRKKRRWDAKPVWPAGTVVFVTDRTDRDFREAERLAGERLPEEGKGEPRGTIRFPDNSEVAYHFAAGELVARYPEMVQGNGIVHAMVETPKSVGQILKQADWTAEGLLALLVELGHVSIGTLDGIKQHDICPELGNDQWKERDDINDKFYKKHGLS